MQKISFVSLRSVRSVRIPALPSFFLCSAVLFSPLLSSSLLSSSVLFCSLWIFRTKNRVFRTGNTDFLARKNPAGTTIKPCRRQQGLSSGFPSHPYAGLHGKLTSNGQLRENFFENICYVPQTILSAECVPYLSPPPVTVCKRFIRRGEGTPPYGFLLRCAGGLKERFGAAISPYEGVRLPSRLSEWGMCPPFRSGATRGVPATRLPPHPVVDSLSLRSNH